MTSLWQDMRYGARMLRKNSSFTLIAVLTLALGIGASTTIFSVVDALMLRTLPVRSPEQLVTLTTSESGFYSSYSWFERYRDLTEVFSGVSAICLVDRYNVKINNPAGGSGLPDLNNASQVGIGLVSGSYFSTLGLGTVIGRPLTADDDRVPGGHPVAVISNDYWERRLGRVADVVRRTLRLNETTYTIVGVAPRGFTGEWIGQPSDIWIPIAMQAQVMPERHLLTDQRANWVRIVARLKPGVALKQAEAAAQVSYQQLLRERAGPNPTPPESQQIARQQLALQSAARGFSPQRQSFGRPLMIVLIVAGLVLLIACANVANLMLARAARRQKEIATRLALGATRGRIIRQLLTESLLIALAGGALGLLLAWWALSVLYPLLLAGLPIPATFRASMAINLEPDYRVFGFTLLMALLAGVAAGLAPAWQASRPSLTSALKGEGSVFGEHLSQSRLRNALIVAQLAFSLVLLVSAGLLVRNLQKLQTIDTGFETARLFTAEADLGKARAPQTEALRQQLETRLRALPDVVSVSRTSHAPLSGEADKTAVALPGQTDAVHLLGASYDFVSPSHLATLGVPLLHGRNFTEQEANAGARVVVISAATVRELWPQFNDPAQALGQSLSIQTEGNDATNPANFPVYQVIGVTRDLITGMVFRRDGPFLYLPFQAGKQGGGYLLVRTRADASRVMATMHAETAALNPNATLALKATAEWLAAQTTPFRSAANLALVLGLVALLLAAIGLYGVMSFVVAQRTREIGIRVALGAEPRGILTLFVKQGMRLIGIGILLGLLGGAAIARLLALILVDLSPFDPLTFGGVSLCLMAVALLATWLPAMRAAKVDPMIALRHD